MEAAWRQTGPSFWPTGGQGLTTQGPRNRLGWPKRLDQRCASHWTGSKGRVTGNQGRCQLGSCISSKFFHPLTYHPDFPFKPLNLPSLHDRQTGKREAVCHSQFPCHHTDSLVHEPLGAGGIAGSMPDLFMTYTLTDKWLSLCQKYLERSDRPRS